MTTTGTIVTTTTATGGGQGIESILAITMGKREDGEQATDVVALTFHTHDIVGVFVMDKEFEFRFAVRAVVLVEWHKKNTSRFLNERALTEDHQRRSESCRAAGRPLWSSVLYTVDSGEFLVIVIELHFRFDRKVTGLLRNDAAGR